MVVATGELRLNEPQLVGTQATLGELRLNEPQIVGTQATLGELRLNEPQIRIFTLAQMHFFLSSPLCVARRLRMALGLTSSAG